jgi:curved DNA-binding protein CbpA
MTDVLRTLFLARATGQMSLTRLGEERTLWFDRGQLASAASNREAQEVGALLRNFGLADESILFSAFERALTEPGRGLAKALRETGAVQPFVADACVRALAEKILFDTFRWTSGAFTFTELETLPVLPVRFDQTNASLILEALRRLPAEAPRPGRRVDPRARPIVTSDLTLRYQVVTMLAEEFDVLGRIDGVRTAGEAATDVSVLERLLAIGLVEIRAVPAAGSEVDTAPSTAHGLNVEVAGARPVARSAEILERQIAMIWNTYRRVDWANFYDILGVPKTAPFEEIQRAAHERARIFHPDNAIRPALQEARDALEILFKRVRDAARAFRSDESRASYDGSLAMAGQSVAVGATGANPEMQREIARKNYVRARQLVEQEDYFPALEMIRQSIEFDSMRPEYWILLSRIQRKNPRWIRQGTDTLRRAVQKMPESVDLWYELSEMCLLERNEPERVKALKEILKIDPANRRAQQALAEIASMKPGKG